MTIVRDEPSHTAIMRAYGKLREVGQALRGLRPADQFAVVRDFVNRMCGVEVVGLSFAGAAAPALSFRLPDGTAGVLPAGDGGNACGASLLTELDHFTITYLADLLGGDGVGSEAPTAASCHLVGATRAMRSVRGLIGAYARSDSPVLILGERGTGKGMTARLLHGMRGGGEATFFPISCAALPAALAESELFGHRKGAFTGAARDRDGLLLTAFHACGTILLDEVAELAPEIQPKLLEALEEGTFRPLGADCPVSILRHGRKGIRISAATQREALPKLRADLRDQWVSRRQR